MGYIDKHVNTAVWMTRKQKKVLKAVAKNRKLNLSQFIRLAIKNQMDRMRQSWPE